MVTDIREQRSNVMNRTRDVSNSISFSQHVGGSLVSDNENMVKNFSLIPSMLGRGHIIVEPCGPIWSIATSEFHPHVAVGSADGTCQSTNILKSTRRGGAVPFLIHKIYQMDYNRNSGEFRMLENFMPYVCLNFLFTFQSCTNCLFRNIKTGLLPLELTKIKSWQLHCQQALVLGLQKSALHESHGNRAQIWLGHTC